MNCNRAALSPPGARRHQATSRRNRPMKRSLLQISDRRRRISGCTFPRALRRASANGVARGSAVYSTNDGDGWRLADRRQRRRRLLERRTIRHHQTAARVINWVRSVDVPRTPPAAVPIARPSAATCRTSHRTWSPAHPAAKWSKRFPGRDAQSVVLWREAAVTGTVFTTVQAQLIACMNDEGLVVCSPCFRCRQRSRALACQSTEPSVAINDSVRGR